LNKTTDYLKNCVADSNINVIGLLYAKIVLKLVQVSGCYCKMFWGHFLWTQCRL